MLEFRLLGRFEVRVDGQPLILPSRLGQSLLAYLLVTRNASHRRERLAGLFWPDTIETNARRSLRRELWRLRSALDAASPASSDLILSDDLSVGIDPQATFCLDVAQLEETNAIASADDLQRALDVYRGDLLPDFYDEWITLERERLHMLFEQQVERLLDQLCAERRWKETLHWAERWLALGAAPEPAYRALMVAHSALGNRAQMAAVFQRCVAALQTNLAVEPSETTRALYERLAHSPEAHAKGTAPVTGSSSLLPTFVVVDHAPNATFKAPYKGLHYFEEADAEWFFGRERLVSVLLDHLAEHHWLTIVGASGSGKSSLVRAGLIPALIRDRTPDLKNKPSKQSREKDRLGKAWVVHLLTPTAHPLEALALELTRNVESATATTTLADDFARDPRALRVYCHKTVSTRGRLLLVIDQFEELYTLCHEELERRAFVDNLLRATAPELEQPTSVVVALRADFYAYAAQDARLSQALSWRQECISPMSDQELRQAIEGPAQRGGYELEPGLADLILRDAGTEPGGLPLLSHALLETWKRRRGEVLTFEGYMGCGGLRGAIAQTAETVLHRLTPEGQRLARHIFLQLTELGEGTQDTRRRVKTEDLTIQGADVSQVRAVLNTLAEARLVTLGADTAEVAHEALIREWPTLREWLSQDREALRLHRQLTAAAQAWENVKRDESELYRGTRLAQTLEWAKTWAAELNPLERGFLDASKVRQAREEAEREAQRQRELKAAQRMTEAEARRADAEQARAEEQVRSNRRLRLRAFWLASALLVAAVLAVLAAAFGEQASENAARAENEQRLTFARELSVNSIASLDADTERSLLLALQAVAVSTANGQSVLPEAEEALHRAVQASRVLLTLRGHAANLSDGALSPDGRRLATASADGTAKVWDLTNGNELLTLRGHTDALQGLAFSPDGKKLATVGSDKMAKVWDAETAQELITLRGHTNAVRRVAFSPDGTRLATASLDGTAKVWDASTGRELITLRGHGGGVSCIAFSPDGQRVVTGSWSDELEHTARVWDANTGQVQLILKGHTINIMEIAFSPDGKWIATTGSDKTVRIWDGNSGQSLLTLFIYSNGASIAFSPDGTRLSTGDSDGTAKVWDAKTGELLQTLAGHTSPVSRVAFIPDGTRLATASLDGTAKIWDITPAGGREWLTVGYPVAGGFTTALAYSPDGTRLAAGGSDGAIHFLDSQTGTELLTLSGHTGAVAETAYSPDGKRLATAGKIDDTIKILDTTTGQVLLQLANPSHHDLFGPRLAFSPDGRLIAAGAEGETAKVWDSKTGAALLTLCCNTPFARGVAFSPDGTRLATTGMDRFLRIWDLASLLKTGAQTGRELLALSGHTGLIWAVTYSRDGRRIATASQDGTAKVWDAATGKELLTLSGHSGSVNDVTFSPDGALVATAGSDSTAKIWNVLTPGGRSEQPLTLYSPQAGTTKCLAFSPDGKRLAVSMSGGNLRVFAVPLQDIVALAKSRLTRSLTKDECRKFLHMEQCPP